WRSRPDTRPLMTTPSLITTLDASPSPTGSIETWYQFAHAGLLSMIPWDARDRRGVLLREPLTHWQIVRHRGVRLREVGGVTCGRDHRRPDGLWRLPLEPPFDLR